MWTAARQATAQSDWEAAEPYLEEALELFRGQGRGREVVFALSELGASPCTAPTWGQPRSVARRRSRSRASSVTPRAESGALSILAEVARTKGEHERALALSEEAVVLRRAFGDPLLITDSTYHIGIAAFGAGDLERAEHEFEATLSLARERGRLPPVQGGRAVHARDDLVAHGRSLAGPRPTGGKPRDLHRPSKIAGALPSASAPSAGPLRRPISRAGSAALGRRRPPAGRQPAGVRGSR